MASTYPYPPRTRHRFYEVISGSGSGSCSAISGSTNLTISLPRSAYAIGITAHCVSNDQPVVFKVAKWVDEEQTIVADSSYKFLKTGGSTATTNVTVPTATATQVGQSLILIPAGDQYGAAAPALPIYGVQVTITTTATTGTWNFSYSAVEI